MSTSLDITLRLLTSTRRPLINDNEKTKLTVEYNFQIRREKKKEKIFLRLWRRAS